MATWLITQYLRTLCLQPLSGRALRSLSLHAREPLDYVSLGELNELQFLDAITGALFQWRARSFWFGRYAGGESFHNRLLSS